MRGRIKKTLFTGAAVLFLGCAYAFWLRMTGLGIPCVFHLVTGWKCPGCGISHMLLSLMRLDFGAAFGYNAVLLCVSPFLLVLSGLWICRYIRYGRSGTSRFERILEIALAGVLVAWGIVRNVIGM